MIRHTERTSSLIRRIRDTLLRYHMLAGGEMVVVAVSGGPDSTGLLHLLTVLRSDLRLSLHVAHFNHLLRPEAGQDAAFVAEMSRKLGWPYHQGGGETRVYAEREHLSLEDAARRLRYKFLRGVAHDVGAQVVATAHTRDDQAETVVMRLLRGSGLWGLSGIPPVRTHDGVRLIRPLIDVPHAEIEAYLRAAGIPWREDPTNQDLTILRNVIRSVFLPTLEGYNPDVRQSLARLADLLRDDAEALEHLAAPHLAGVLSDGPGPVRIAREPFSRLPVALQRRAVREAVRRTRGNVSGIEFVHVEGARRVILEGRPGATCELPGGLRVRRLSADAEVSGGESGGAAPGEYRLDVPGSVVAAEFGVQLVATDAAADSREVQARASHPTSQEIVLDRERMGGTIVLRGPRVGERFAPWGMRGRTKKVSDYLIERRIPRHRRRFVPIVATPEGEILWIVGMRASESARVTNRTTRVVRLEVRRLWA